MSAKTSAEVIIGGKVYTLSGYESEEYLQKVAGYINNKLSDFNEIKEYRHLPVPMKATLMELNIADDYFKAKSRVEKLENEIEHKDREIYDLKHDLISAQIKTQTIEAANTKLEAEKQELQLEVARLETTLKDRARMELSTDSEIRSQTKTDAPLSADGSSQAENSAAQNSYSQTSSANTGSQDSSANVGSHSVNTRSSRRRNNVSNNR